MTRKTVFEAFRKIKPFKDKLVGNAYLFGEGATLAPMQSTRILKLDRSQWKVMTPTWLTLPAS